MSKKNLKICNKSRYTLSDVNLTVLVHEVRSLSKHVNDLVSDDKIKTDDNVGITEAQINFLYSIYKVVVNLEFL